MAKKGSFANPIAPRENTCSFDFVAPSKEQATTGRFMDAGNTYGVGFRQPVGHEGAPKERAPTMPMESKCFSPDDTI